MKKLILFLVAILSGISLQAQITAPPLNMTLHAQWDADTLPTAGSREYNDIWGWVDCSGNEYAIMGSAAYIHFFDVTDPDTIVELDFFAGGQVGAWRDIKTYKDRAYAVSENSMEGLMIFDMSNIQDTIIKTYQSSEFFNRSHNIFVDNEHGRLYCVGTQVQNQGIIILDIATDPDNPILLASVPLPGGGYVHDIYVKDHIGYCSHGYSGFYMWDFTDPLNPEYIIDIPSSGYNHSSWTTADGNYAIYAEEVPLGQPLGIYDISDVANGNIGIVSTFKFPLLAPDHVNNVPHNPYIRGDYAIVSHYHDGIQIFDISDVENPQQVAYYDSHANNNYSGYSGCWGVYPFFPSGNIIASDINEGLLVLSANNITFEAIDPPVAPTANILNGDLYFCAGEALVLVADPSGQEYFWYLNDQLISTTSVPSLSVMEEGNYYVVVTNSECEAQSLTVTVQRSELPDPNINVIGDPMDVSDTSASYCENDPISLQVQSYPDAQYVWMNDAGQMVGTNDNLLLTPGAGNFSVSITTAEGCMSSSIVFTLEALAAAAEASFENGILVSTTAQTYQWHLNGSLISGATGMEYTPTENGSYYVETVASNGCAATSNIIEVTLDGIDEIAALEHFSISPNPTFGSVVLHLELSAATNMTIQILHIDGRILKTAAHSISGVNAIPLDLSDLAAGVYVVALINEEGKAIRKVIKK